MNSSSLCTCVVLVSLSVSPLVFGQTTGTGTSGSTSRSTTTRQAPSTSTRTVAPGAGTVTSPAATVGGTVDSAPGVVAPGVNNTATETGTDFSGETAEPAPVADPVPGGAFLPGSAPADAVEGNEIDEAAGATATQFNPEGTSGNAAFSQRQTALRTDAQTRALAQQVDTAVQLGGTSSVFFPESNSVISLSSTDGVVTLRGDVATVEQSQSLANAIASLPNVIMVNNELTVTTPAVQRDAEQQSERVPLQPLQPVP
jgi:hypothetical protein